MAGLSGPPCPWAQETWVVPAHQQAGKQGCCKAACFYLASLSPAAPDSERGGEMFHAHPLWGT